jgi:uncharacterized membrane protein YhaH (DUF805 family)
MKYYLQVLKNYAGFIGRARRSEYWYFVLFNLIFAVIAMIIDNLLDTTFKFDLGEYGSTSLPYGYVYIAYALVVFIPGLAVSVRRLHDVGKSGWFLLVSLIPLAGAIWLLVILCTEGENRPNAYGEDPKASATELV